MSAVRVVPEAIVGKDVLVDVVPGQVRPLPTDERDDAQLDAILQELKSLRNCSRKSFVYKDLNRLVVQLWTSGSVPLKLLFRMVLFHWERYTNSFQQKRRIQQLLLGFCRVYWLACWKVKVQPFG